MDVSIIKSAIRGRIKVLDMRAEEQRRNGDNALIEDFAKAELNSLLESIESFEMDEL